MAFIQCSFHSDVLGKACSMNVLLPQKVTTQIGMTSSGSRSDLPVLYLLHGLSDDHSIWMRRTSIERYAASYPLAIVMPDGGRSFYTDMKYGAKYWTFLSEELPEIVCSLFPVSRRREDTFAAGLSMGGYGALKLGLRCPEKFAAVAGMSSVTDYLEFLHMLADRGEDGKAEALRFFGTLENIPEKEDLFALAAQAAQNTVKPKVFQCCGTEDMLYDMNIRFRDKVSALDLDYIYHEAPGVHSWEFWDFWIQEILKWLPLEGK